MRTFNELHRNGQVELIDIILEELEHNFLLHESISDRYSDLSDLHHRLFNEDYFIIGRYNAEKWIENNIGVFNAIRIVKEYEEFNFGEIYTDLTDPERIVNMLVYIVGEELIYDLDSDITVQDAIDHFKSI